MITMPVKYILLLFFLSSCALFTPTQSVINSESKATLYYNHGTHALMAKDYSKALEHLLLAQQLSPKDSKVQNNLGMTYYMMKRIDMALKHFLSAIKLDEKNSDARNNLASVYFENGQYAQAKVQYKYIKNELIYRHQFRITYNLALISLKEGHTKKAIELLKKATREKTDYCPANFQLGLIYYNKSNYSEANHWFNESQKGVCYSLPAPRYHYGLTLMLQGEYQDSIMVFQNLIEKFPNSKYGNLASLRLSEAKTQNTQFSQTRYSKKKLHSKNEKIQKVKINRNKKVDRNLLIFDSPSF